MLHHLFYLRLRYVNMSADLGRSLLAEKQVSQAAAILNDFETFHIYLSYEKTVVVVVFSKSAASDKKGDGC